MSLFLETIKIHNGRRINLEGHSARMNRTRNAHFHEIRNIDLKKEVQVPETYKKGVVKCRVTYGRAVEEIDFEPYEAKNPQSFQLVNADHILYEYKYADREAIRLLFEERAAADDIIMVKNGFITDSFYANVALLRKGTWYTPSVPLLKGTYREKLVMNEKLVEAPIKLEDIYSFEKIKLVNALLEWYGHQAIEVSKKHLLPY